MDVLMLIVLMYSATFGGSDAAWCVCNSDQSTPALQKTIDYACGAGADCTPILQNGACYEPNTVAAHCSYAANSYYQRKGRLWGPVTSLELPLSPPQTQVDLVAPFQHLPVLQGHQPAAAALPQQLPQAAPPQPAAALPPHPPPHSPQLLEEEEVAQPAALEEGGFLEDWAPQHHHQH
uniref:X8 domain-containing protein n=1 Tax=Ananas comosus var. bracteatus TaxID=296719 RepID=A0A6V7NW76_ANACO|nr:unnamed protein product [Ananas comosus var. bracteatus]